LAQAGEGSGGAPAMLVCHDGGPGEGATCQSFCEGWFPVCSDYGVTAAIYADMADCLDQCRGFNVEQLCCRGYHIKNAPGRPTTHCMHSAGLRTCT
jgi:hypothetical protein